jgi:hypothetical protein
MMEASARAFEGASAYELTDSQREHARLVEVCYPGVKAAHDVTFEDIWGLFLESGFLYPEKVARLQPVIAEIQQTVRALLQANGSLMATVALRNETGLDAQISMLRWCQQTWIVQHLAALPLSARALDASAQVTLALIYYGQLRPDIQWGKMYFRPNNAWPSRVFGGFARQVKDASTSDFRVFHYLVAPTNGPAQGVSGAVRVRPASGSDFALIEDWFTSRGRMVELAANDLQQGRADLAQVSGDYAKFGINRRRELLVAERDGRSTGFAILEIASLGLNFSELTNAFTVYAAEEDPETRTALALAAKECYAGLGRHQCICLEEGADLAPFEAAGFVPVKDYACWTFHRDHFAAMEEYFVTLFTARRRKNS